MERGAEIRGNRMTNKVNVIETNDTSVNWITRVINTSTSRQRHYRGYDATRRCTRRAKRRDTFHAAQSDISAAAPEVYYAGVFSDTERKLEESFT